MSLDKRKILTPNSGYERQMELLRLFNDCVVLSDEDREVLNTCTTEVPETIGLIGCILKEDSNINNARLLIASLHKYNTELVESANKILNKSEKEINTLIDELSMRFLIETEELSEYEDKVYFILFELLSHHEQRR